MTWSYFNSKADIWDEKIAEKDFSKLENMAKNLYIQTGSKVLDVGTGTGIFIPFLLQKIGDKGELFCLDSAERMLEKARKKNFNGNIEYVCSDISNTQLGDEIFDVVVCYSSFPHFRDKAKALVEIKRLLKKGGRLFICHTSSRVSINEIHQRIPVPTRKRCGICFHRQDLGRLMCVMKSAVIWLWLKNNRILCRGPAKRLKINFNSQESHSQSCLERRRVLDIDHLLELKGLKFLPLGMQIWRGVSHLVPLGTKY
jgi:ubiquinone/menaquinone biosynthesis C-methylase UbiE